MKDRAGGFPWTASLAEGWSRVSHGSRSYLLHCDAQNANRQEAEREIPPPLLGDGEALGGTPHSEPSICQSLGSIMGTTSNEPPLMKFIPFGPKRELKNYADPDVLRHTFETLANLHNLLPNRMMEMLYSYKSDQDKTKCT